MSQPIQREDNLSIWIGGVRPPSARSVATLLVALNDYYRSVPGARGELVLLEARRGSLELLIGTLAVLAGVNTVVAFAKNIGSLVRGVQNGTRKLRSRRGPAERLVQAVAVTVEETQGPLRIGVVSDGSREVVEEVTLQDALDLSGQLAATAPAPRPRQAREISDADTRYLGEIATRIAEARRLNPGSQSELEAVLRAVVATLDEYTLASLVSRMRSSGLTEAADLLEILAEELRGPQREPPIRS